MGEKQDTFLRITSIPTKKWGQYYIFYKNTLFRLQISDELHQGDLIKVLEKNSNKTGGVIEKSEAGKRLIEGEYTIVERGSDSGILTIWKYYWLISQVRNELLKTLSLALPPTTSQFAAGVLFGEKDSQSELYHIFFQTGMLHVVAASGYNVSVLLSFLEKTCKKRLSSWMYFLLGTLVILIYTTLAQWEISITRAAIMSEMLLFSQWRGKRYSSAISLVLAAEILCLMNPYSMVSLSFQLSFASTIAMIWVYPSFSSILKNPKIGKFRGLLDSGVASFACMTLTSPIIIANFGSLNLYSLVTNTLFLWCIPYLMGIFSICLFVSLFFAVFMPLFAEISEFIGGLFLQFLQIFSVFPYTTLEIPKMWWIGAVLVLVCLAIHRRVEEEKSRKHQLQYKSFILLLEENIGTT